MNDRRTVAAGDGGPLSHSKSARDLRGAIAVGGTVVRTGDVVGDTQGVALIPSNRPDEVMGGVTPSTARNRSLEKARSGTMDTSWIPEHLDPPRWRGVAIAVVFRRKWASWIQLAIDLPGRRAALKF